SAADPGQKGDDAEGPTSAGPTEYRSRAQAGFRRLGQARGELRAAVRHRPGVRRRNLEPDHAWSRPPELGEPGSWPLPRADGCLCQAAWSLRASVHGDDQADPVSARVPGADATDRSGMEGSAETNECGVSPSEALTGRRREQGRSLSCALRRSEPA